MVWKTISISEEGYWILKRLKSNLRAANWHDLAIKLEDAVNLLKHKLGTNSWYEFVTKLEESKHEVHKDR